jgi:Tfp pilus assembly protein PilN
MTNRQLSVSNWLGCFQVAEEEYLSAELKRIDQRKKEREKKQQDLQKIIAAADHTERQSVLLLSLVGPRTITKYESINK